MKKCYSLLRCSRFAIGCAQQTFTVQNKTGSSSTKETITHHFFVSGIVRWKKTGRWSSQNSVWQKMLLGKQKTQQTSVNGLLALLLSLGHLYSAGSACVLLTIIAWVAHRYGQLYLHCSLIYFWVPSSCFCIWSASLRGEIIPFSGVCQSGRLHYPRRRRWWLHALTDRSSLLWCATDDDRRWQHHHAEHQPSAFS